jgi:hypothetical protein
MISEIVFETEFALAEITDVLAWLFRHLRGTAIVTFHLYKFVVNADDQPRRNPLHDEVSPMDLVN